MGESERLCGIQLPAGLNRNKCGLASQYQNYVCDILEIFILSTKYIQITLIVTDIQAQKLVYNVNRKYISHLLKHSVTDNSVIRRLSG